MSEQEHLAAIRAAPDDDAPRLVYADWLIERGDPRGELIQLQCRLASEALPNATRRKMRIAENKLIGDYEAKAAGDISELLGFARDARLVRAVLRRRFIAAIKAPVTILRRLDDVLTLAPLVDDIDVQFSLPYEAEPPQLVAADFASPGLLQIRRLRLALPYLDASSLRAIAEAPTLRNVRDFALAASESSLAHARRGLLREQRRKILIHDRDTPDARNALATSSVLANTQVYFREHIVPKA